MKFLERRYAGRSLCLHKCEVSHLCMIETRIMNGVLKEDCGAKEVDVE